MTKATYNKYLKILEKGKISKQEIDSVTRIMREDDRLESNNCALASEIVGKFLRKTREEGMSLTAEQTTLGIEWLNNYMFKKNGQPRQQKDNPFNDYHREIVKNFSHFYLVGFYDISSGMSGVGHYRPIYRVIDKHGRAFDYVPNVPFNGSPIIATFHVSSCDERGVA